MTPRWCGRIQFQPWVFCSWCLMWWKSWMPVTLAFYNMLLNPTLGERFRGAGYIKNQQNWSTQVAEWILHSQLQFSVAGVSLSQVWLIVVWLFRAAKADLQQVSVDLSLSLNNLALDPLIADRGYLDLWAVASFLLLPNFCETLFSIKNYFTDVSTQTAIFLPSSSGYKLQEERISWKVASNIYYFLSTPSMNKTFQWLAAENKYL